TLNGNGVATFQSSGLGVGTHTLTAHYNGDNNFNSSTSSCQSETVQKAITSTILAVSPNPVTLGQALTFTASVNAQSPGAGLPTGSVTFYDGPTVLGPISLDVTGPATFQTSALGSGPHVLTAHYGGDSYFATSTSSSQSESVVGYASHTALTADLQTG